MKIKPYIKLMRFHFHFSFITVVMGALFFSPDFSPEQILANLVKLYIIFNVLIYASLYTFNDIIDVGSDSRHIIKKLRPIPSGEVSIRSAAIFSGILLTTGLVSGYFIFPVKICFIFLLFIILNIIYTLFFKRIVYLNLAIVAGTHSLRLVLGIVISGGVINMMTILAFYCLMFALASTIHSMFNLKQYEIPFYSNKIVFIIQAVSILSAIFMLTKSGETIDLPVSIFCLSFVVFALCSRIGYFRPLIARIFMIKVIPKTDN